MAPALEKRSFFFGLALCLFSVGESPDDDDVAFLFCFLLARALSLCVSLLLVINERNEENARFRSSLSVSRFLFVSIR